MHHAPTLATAHAYAQFHNLTLSAGVGVKEIV